MALLNYLMDVTRGVTLAGYTITSFNHSLGTTPDITLTQGRSYASASCNAALFALDRTATCSTVGMAGASLNLAAPQTVSFDLWAISWWSAIR
jgi:hypothetical protein